MVDKIFRVGYGKTRGLTFRVTFDHINKCVFIHGIWVDKIENNKVKNTDEYRIYHGDKEWEEIETVGFIPEIPEFGKRRNDATTKEET